MRQDNVVLASWPLGDGGVLELKIYTPEPLPSPVWPELSVLMDVAAKFANRVRAFYSLANLPADTPESAAERVARIRDETRAEGSEPGRGIDMEDTEENEFGPAYTFGPVEHDDGSRPVEFGDDQGDRTEVIPRAVDSGE
jgi:hypothetical protein